MASKKDRGDQTKTEHQSIERLTIDLNHVGRRKLSV